MPAIRANLHAKIIDDPSSRSQPYRLSWLQALDGGVDDVIKLATDTTPRGDEHRQCSPLFGVLDPKERWRFFQNLAALMNRSQLEHLVRAAAAVTNEYDFIVIGSQSVLGAFPDAPFDLWSSKSWIFIRARFHRKSWI